MPHVSPRRQFVPRREINPDREPRSKRIVGVVTDPMVTPDHANRVAGILAHGQPLYQGAGKWSNYFTYQFDLDGLTWDVAVTGRDATANMIAAAWRPGVEKVSYLGWIVSLPESRLGLSFGADIGRISADSVAVVVAGYSGTMIPGLNQQLHEAPGFTVTVLPAAVGPNGITVKNVNLVRELSILAYEFEPSRAATELRNRVGAAPPLVWATDKLFFHTAAMAAYHLVDTVRRQHRPEDARACLGPDDRGVWGMCPLVKEYVQVGPDADGHYIEGDRVVSVSRWAGMTDTERNAAFLDFQGAGEVNGVSMYDLTGPLSPPWAVVEGGVSDTIAWLLKPDTNLAIFS